MAGFAGLESVIPLAATATEAVEAPIGMSAWIIARERLSTITTIVGKFAIAILILTYVT